MKGERLGERNTVEIYLLSATVESWVVPATVASVGNALAVTSSELAIAKRSQISFLSEGDIAPLFSLIVVERVAFLISTALIEAIESSSIVAKARVSGDFKVAESEKVVGSGMLALPGKRV